MGQLFSKKNKEVFSAPLGIDNPVTVQVLGICSALAVTAKLEPAIVMGLSVTVITAFANVVISLLRKTIPESVCLRRKRTALCLCRFDYHQLYLDGTSGSICHAERSLGVFLGWCR